MISFSPLNMSNLSVYTRSSSMSGPEKKSSPRSPAETGFFPYITADVQNRLTSIPVILCCFTSGMVDANVYEGWGVFAGGQTGNTVFLGLGAANRPADRPKAWLQSIVSIFFFFSGCFLSCQVLGTLFGARPLRRINLSVSFTTQALLVAVAAALVQTGVVPGQKLSGFPPGGVEDYITLVPLGLLAFQSGQQSVVAREFGFMELPTTVLTSTYLDLGNDRRLFSSDNWPRNRRALSVVALLLGAIVGSWLSRTTDGMAAGLWFVMCVKAVIAIAWLFWKEDPNQSEEMV